MNAAIVRAFDAPPRYTTFEEPVAGEGEVIGEGECGGAAPDCEVAGEWDALWEYGGVAVCSGSGWGGAGWRMGGGFISGSARSPFGTFAERTVASAAMCLPLPEGLDDAWRRGWRIRRCRRGRR